MGRERREKKIEEIGETEAGREKKERVIKETETRKRSWRERRRY